MPYKSSEDLNRWRAEWRMKNRGRENERQLEYYHRRKTDPAWKARHDESGKQSRRRMRLRAIERMGGECESCSISETAVLEFDHRIPVHRRSNGTTARTSETVRAILDSADPFVEFALLCANCHKRKTRANEDHIVPECMTVAKRAEDCQLTLFLGPLPLA